MQKFDVGSHLGWVLNIFLNLGFFISLNTTVGIVTMLVGITTIAVNVQKFIQNRKRKGE